ncbi:MAG: sigma-70 family RNA polymerase sigma factor [Myxococcales bacterium]|nr:sigma-70 family RNA polymerase sigma factor [Myxococcales bacterium]MCB9545749.1 sigma-70 family RNA polymerase sigma factor [Myxococcales bacterium]
MFQIFAKLLAFRRPPPEDDGALVRACLDGDRRAGRALLDRLLPVVHARVRRCLRGASLEGVDAEDLVQAIWVGLLAEDGRVLRAWDPTRGASLQNYVGQIAQRKTLNALEHARAARRGGGAAGLPLDEARDEALGPPADARAEDRDLLDRLATHLKAALPERGWLVFRLLYTDGCEVGEVADALQVTAQVVYNWRFRIRKEAEAFLAAAEVSP